MTGLKVSRRPNEPHNQGVCKVNQANTMPVCLSMS